MSPSEQKYQQQLFELLKQDPFRMDILAAVQTLKLPDCYIGAGFVRNLVWDHLHHYKTPTPLNDVDVVYLDTNKTGAEFDLSLEKQLTQRIPAVNWQVRNQARMHVRNGHQPYKNTQQAVGFWIEKQTAVAVRLHHNQLEGFACFGWEPLFSGELSANPLRDAAIFEQRVTKKDWLTRWPKLKLVAP